MARQIAHLTTARGWALVALIAVAAYFTLGVVGLAAWIAGVISGLSVTNDWREDGDHRRGSTRRGRAPLPGESWDDGRLRFATVRYPRRDSFGRF